MISPSNGNTPTLRIGCTDPSNVPRHLQPVGCEPQRQRCRLRLHRPRQLHHPVTRRRPGPVRVRRGSQPQRPARPQPPPTADAGHTPTSVHDQPPRGCTSTRARRVHDHAGVDLVVGARRPQRPGVDEPLHRRRRRRREDVGHAGRHHPQTLVGDHRTLGQRHRTRLAHLTTGQVDEAQPHRRIPDHGLAVQRQHPDVADRLHRPVQRPEHAATGRRRTPTSAVPTSAAPSPTAAPPRHPSTSSVPCGSDEAVNRSVQHGPRGHRPPTQATPPPRTRPASQRPPRRYRRRVHDHAGVDLVVVPVVRNVPVLTNRSTGVAVDAVNMSATLVDITHRPSLATTAPCGQRHRTRLAHLTTGQVDEPQPHRRHPRPWSRCPTATPRRCGSAAPTRPTSRTRCNRSAANPNVSGADFGCTDPDSCTTPSPVDVQVPCGSDEAFNRSVQHGPSRHRADAPATPPPRPRSASPACTSTLPGESTITPELISLLDCAVDRNVPVLTNRSTGDAADAVEHVGQLRRHHPQTLVDAPPHPAANVTAPDWRTSPPARLTNPNPADGITDDGLAVQRQHPDVADRLHRPVQRPEHAATGRLRTPTSTAPTSAAPTPTAAPSPSPVAVQVPCGSDEASKRKLQHGAQPPPSPPDPGHTPTSSTIRVASPARRRCPASPRSRRS